MGGFLRPIQAENTNQYARTIGHNLAGSFLIPRGARIARVSVDQNVHYTFNSFVSPTASRGFELSAGTHDIDIVSGIIDINLFAVDASTNVYIEYFGADAVPSVQLLNNYTTTLFAAGNITLDFPETATYLLVHHDHGTSSGLRITTDGSNPSATRGIYIASNENVKIPCYRAVVKVAGAGGGATGIQFQAFSDHHVNGGIWQNKVWRNAGGFYQANLPSTAIDVDVPANARWAWISASSQGGGIKYTTSGHNPTASQRGFVVGANSNAKVAVSPGTDRLKILRQGSGADVTVMFYA